jgi:iron(III) transport system substrate-binding protein
MRLPRRQLLRGLLGGSAVLLLGCQPGGTAAPADEPSAPGAAAPDGQAQWNALVEAARKEGKVVVKGPPDPQVRVDLPRAFRQRFGIELEYLGGPTGPFANQLLNERQAGVYSTDVVLAGADSMYLAFYGEGVLQPLLPALIYPDALDAARWPDEKLWFMDPEGQYILRLNNSVVSMGQINTAYVRPEEIASWYDLLKPAYRERIAAFDPTVTGTGVGTAAYLYVSLGEDYVRRLYVDQKPALSRDDRQLADWLARGAYPIAMGGDFATPANVAEFEAAGVTIASLPRPPEAPGAVSPSFGLLGLVDRPPHPSAAQVFVNWIAAREGMEVWSKAHMAVPIRTDIDKSYWPKDRVPNPSVKTYHDSYGWDFVLNERQQVMSRLRELLR